MAGASGFEKSDLAEVALIEKIAGFIQWPRPPGESFNICVTADHPQLAVLEAYYQHMTVNDRPAAIVTVKLAAPPSECQVLYLTASQLSNLGPLLAWSARENVLLVGDSPDAASQGVQIAFYFSMNRLQLEVNRRSMEASGLKPSFKLMQVAKIVE